MMPTKWRYRSEFIVDTVALNRMGAEGWELVSVDCAERGEGIGFCVFKMPIGKLAKQ